MLAVPFVVTLAAGCGKAGTEPPPLAPDVPAPAPDAPLDVPTPDAGASPSPDAAPPAMPTPDAGAARSPDAVDAGAVAVAPGAGGYDIVPAPPLQPAPGRWVLTKRGATCEVKSSSGAAKAWKCPPDVTHYPTNIVRNPGSTECAVLVHASGHCPAGALCNPPPPRSVKTPCPQ